MAGSENGAKAPYWVHTPRDGSDPPQRTSGSGAAQARGRRVRKGQELYVPPKTNPACPPQDGLPSDSPQASTYKSYDDYDDDYSQPSGGRRRSSKHHSNTISPQQLSARSSPGPEPSQPRSARGPHGTGVPDRIPFYYGDVTGARDKSPGTLAAAASAAAAAALQGGPTPTPLFGGMPRGVSGSHIQRATSHASLGSGTSWMAGGPDAPSNPGFRPPGVPQPDATRITSINGWALMVEAGANNLESVLAPLAQAILADQSTSPSSETLPATPWTAQVVLDLLLKAPISERLSLAQGAQLDAASKAIRQLMDAADTLTASDAIAAHQAFQGVLQDFVKALEQPSLLRSGSAQYQQFLDTVLRPELGSALVYAGMLMSDAQESEQVHEAYSAAVVALSSPKIIQAGRDAEISLAGGLAATHLVSTATH